MGYLNLPDPACSWHPWCLEERWREFLFTFSVTLVLFGLLWHRFQRSRTKTHLRIREIDTFFFFFLTRLFTYCCLLHWVVCSIIKPSIFSFSSTISLTPSSLSLVNKIGQGQTLNQNLTLPWPLWTRCSLGRLLAPWRHPLHCLLLVCRFLPAFFAASAPPVWGINCVYVFVLSFHSARDRVWDLLVVIVIVVSKALPSDYLTLDLCFFFFFFFFVN